MPFLYNLTSVHLACHPHIFHYLLSISPFPEPILSLPLLPHPPRLSLSLSLSLFSTSASFSPPQSICPSILNTYTLSLIEAAYSQQSTFQSLSISLSIYLSIYLSVYLFLSFSQNYVLSISLIYNVYISVTFRYNLYLYISRAVFPWVFYCFLSISSHFSPSSILTPPPPSFSGLLFLYLSTCLCLHFFKPTCSLFQTVFLSLSVSLFYLSPSLVFSTEHQAVIILFRTSSRYIS